MSSNAPAGQHVRLDDNGDQLEEQEGKEQNQNPHADQGLQPLPQMPVGYLINNLIKDFQRLQEDKYYDWERHLKNLLYAMEHETIYEASLTTPVSKAPNIPKRNRIQLFVLIQSKLTPKIFARTKKIPMGDVENLLRSVRDMHYNNTMASEFSYREKLSRASLDNHDDIDELISYIEEQRDILLTIGAAAPEEEVIFHLFKALPRDYDSVVTVCKIPRQPKLTFEQIVTMLRNFALTNSNVPGTISPNRKVHKDEVQTFQDDRARPRREACRNFLRGKCRRGANCLYSHDSPPQHQRIETNGSWRRDRPFQGTCNTCKQHGHRGENCPRAKEFRDFMNKSKNSISTPTDSNNSAVEEKTGAQFPGFTSYGDIVTVSISNQSKTTSDQWLIDSGATCHVTHDKSICYDIVERSSTIQVGGGNTIPVIGFASVDVSYTIQGQTKTLTLNNVRLSPSFGRNIICEHKFVTSGHLVAKTDGRLTVTADKGKGIILIDAPISNDLVYLPNARGIPARRVTSEDGKVYLARSYTSTDISELHLAHNRFGHLNFNECARIIDAKVPDKPIFCKACVEAKATRYPIGPRDPMDAPQHEAPRAAYLFHSDLAGPFRVQTRSGKRYALILVDDYSRRIFLYMLRSPSDFLPLFKHFSSHLEAEFGRDKVIAQIKSDCDPRIYITNAFNQYCKQKGIYPVYSPPYTQALNGVAERTIRTVVEMARTMLSHSGAPLFLYGEALLYATFILNHCTTHFRDGTSGTRMERWYGRPQPNSHRPIRVFGCAAWALNKDVLEGRSNKLAPKSTLYVLLGIDPQRKCYRLAQIPHFKLVFSIHVTFHECKFPMKKSQNLEPAPDYSIIQHNRPHVIQEPIISAPSPGDRSVAANRPRRGWTPSLRALEGIADTTTNPPSKDIAEMSIAIEKVFSHNSPASGVEPKNHREAMSRPDAQKWRGAEIEECISHDENDTLSKPVILPPGAHVVPCAWVYKIKRDGRYKARIIIRGYHMLPGVDFNETFAPVARVTSVRIILAIACKQDLELIQLDIKTAFLSAEMDTEVYVSLPAGFSSDPSLNIPDGNSKTIHRLKKGIPGIPQGSRLFNKKIHKALLAMDFERLNDDFCVYKHTKLDVWAAIVLWVDDIVLAHHRRHRSFADKVTSDLKAHFKVHVLGPVSDLLGVSITRDRARLSMTLDQSKATSILLSRAGMDSCKPVPTPVASNFVFTKKDCPSTDHESHDLAEQAKWYRSILASCIYLSTWTRPDISFAVSKLSKYMHNPGAKHIEALKRLLRFLKGSESRCLCYEFSNGPDSLGVYGYFDASHADDVDTRKSTMAYIFFYFGCPISWNSKLHTYVTTSTNHSEYVASSKAAKEAKWLSKIFTALGTSDVLPIHLFSDSLGAIAMNHNPVHHQASKHVDLADHFARECVERGIVTISPVKSKDMIADVLTKIMGKTEFYRLTDLFMCKGALS